MLSQHRHGGACTRAGVSPRCSQNMRMAQREEAAALVETPARPMLCHLGQGFGTHRQDEDNQFRVISKCNIERARVPPSTLTGTHQATACITAAGTRGPVPPTTRTNGGSRFVLELGTQTPTHATTHARKQTHTHTGSTPGVHKLAAQSNLIKRCHRSGAKSSGLLLL